MYLLAAWDDRCNSFFSGNDLWSPPVVFIGEVFKELIFQQAVKVSFPSKLSPVGSFAGIARSDSWVTAAKVLVTSFDAHLFQLTSALK